MVVPTPRTRAMSTLRKSSQAVSWCWPLYAATSVGAGPRPLRRDGLQHLRASPSASSSSASQLPTAPCHTVVRAVALPLMVLLAAGKCRRRGVTDRHAPLGPSMSLAVLVRLVVLGLTGLPDFGPTAAPYGLISTAWPVPHPRRPTSSTSGQLRQTAASTRSARVSSFRRARRRGGASSLRTMRRRSESARREIRAAGRGSEDQHRRAVRPGPRAPHGPVGDLTNLAHGHTSGAFPGRSHLPLPLPLLHSAGRLMTMRRVRRPHLA